LFEQEALDIPLLLLATLTLRKILQVGQAEVELDE
jgi:hypothetical protein